MITASGVWLNPDFVQMVYTEGVREFAQTVDGETFALQPDQIGTIVPAADGWLAAFVVGGTRPAIKHVPITAWRVFGRVSYPIVVQWPRDALAGPGVIQPGGVQIVTPLATYDAPEKFIDAVVGS